MGWGSCGYDSQGRPIGYGTVAYCDHYGCMNVIDRGLSYACGGTHGDEFGCEKYFCNDHRAPVVAGCWPSDNGGEMCLECAKRRCDDCGREDGAGHTPDCFYHGPY